MSHVLDVSAGQFAAASRVFGASVANGLERAGQRLTTALAGTGSMAGSDPSGLSWATSYDTAASACVRAMQDVTNGCYRLAALLEQTGFNYAGAESASTLHVAWRDPDRTRWDAHAVTLSTPPPAAGGNVPMPHGWSLVSHLIDLAWPNGHQDVLRAAAGAWTATADALDAAAWQAAAADGCLMAEVTPEMDAALTATAAMQRHLRDVAAAHRALGRACEEYAHQLDTAHHQVIGELVSLIEWTAAIETGGALLSFVTMGLAEAPTQAAEAGRLAVSAARITAVLRTCAMSVEASRAVLLATGERVVAVQLRLRVLLDSRVVVAGVRAARAVPHGRVLITGEDAAIRAMTKATRFRMPELIAPIGQLESHYKHAVALGVMTKRSAAGFREYRAALAQFLDEPTTVRMVGLYHRRQSILSVNPTTRICVIQKLDGEFVSVWNLDDAQYMHVITKGSLGGGR